MARLHGKQTVVYLDGYDLTGDSNQFDVSAEADTADVTAFSDDRKQYVIGHEAGRVEHRGWFNDAVDKIHEILEARAGETSLVLSAAWGTSIGSKGVAGSASLENAYNVNSPIGGAVGITAEYQSSGPTGFEYVEVLHPKSNLTGTSTPKDDGAASSGGLRAYMQRFSILGGTPDVVLYHGTAPSGAWQSIGTFAGGTTVTGAALAVAGSVQRYLMGSVANGSANVWLGYRRL